MLAALALAFPDIDPVAFAIGPVVVRWYALAYMLGILGAWRYLGWLDRHPNAAPSILEKKAYDDMMLWGVLGVILGGRLGYVLFYNLEYFLGHPAEIPQLWQGGMSFHGGALGVIIGFYLFARKHGYAYKRLMDRICCAVPIGLFLGRLANFANGELYGRVSDVSWAMVFPHGGPLARHPSQLYEAALEGLVLFVLLWCCATKAKAFHYPGRISGLFLAGYGLARFIVEFFREPDAHLGLLLSQLSMGQWLCIPMMLVGLWLVISPKKHGHVAL